MRLTLKTLLFSSAALCSTAAFAVNAARVNVPFSFTAKGQSYPAGTYDVSVSKQENFVTMANKADPSHSITWIVGPAELAKTPAVITFDVVPSGYALKTVQLGNRITPNLDPHGKPGLSATTSISGE